MMNSTPISASARCFSTLLLLVLAHAASAEDSRFPFEQISPWGGQGEVRLGPDASEAELLKAALIDERDRLQWVADQGGFPAIESATVLDLGVVDPGVEVLRLRLSLSNDLPEALNWPAASFEARTYDFDVMQAVQRFQLRHGLDATGLVDDTTRELLNAPVEAWIAQIEDHLCHAQKQQTLDAPGPGVKDGVVIFTGSITTARSCSPRTTASLTTTSHTTVARPVAFQPATATQKAQVAR